MIKLYSILPAIMKGRMHNSKATGRARSFILFLFILAVCADFIANEKPLMVKYKGTVYFPVLRSYGVNAGVCEWPESIKNTDWHNTTFERAFFPPIPYSPGTIDYDNANFKGPFDRQSLSSLRWRHWLGTDHLGHDIAAVMIHGARIALFVGILSMLLASFIGLLAGSIAGYYRDNKLRTSAVRIILNLSFLLPAYFYAFYLRKLVLAEALKTSFFDAFLQIAASTIICLFILAIANIIAWFLEKRRLAGRYFSLPLDMIISRIIEGMQAIPPLFLIVAILAVARPSVWWVILAIGLTSWAGIARIVRGELIKIQGEGFIEASSALGIPKHRILLNHALPNILSPVIITIAFGVAGTITAEATLSFLGVGLPADVLSWGSVLAEAKTHPSAWWLAVFPGAAIFLTVFSYNILGEKLSAHK